MREVITDTRFEILGYLEVAEDLEILRDKHGRTLGTYDRKTTVTRDAEGHIVGYLVNQLMRLL